MVPFLLRYIFVSSFFSALRSPIHDFPFPRKSFWFALAPSKVQAFLWKIAWKSPFLGRYLIFPHISLCPNIFPCVYRLRNPMSTYFFISILFGNCGVNSFNWRPLLGDCLFSWNAILVNWISRKLYILSLQGVIWAAWMDHNRRVFQNTLVDVSLVWESFLYFICIL